MEHPDYYETLYGWCDDGYQVSYVKWVYGIDEEITLSQLIIPCFVPLD